MVYVASELFQLEIPLGQALYCYSGNKEGFIAIRDKDTGKSIIIKPFYDNKSTYKSDHNTVDVWVYIHEINDYHIRAEAENRFFEAYCFYYDKYFNNGELYIHQI